MLLPLLWISISGHSCWLLLLLLLMEPSLESLTELLQAGEEQYQRLWRKLHLKNDNNVLRHAALEDQKNLLLKIA